MPQQKSDLCTWHNRKGSKVNEAHFAQGYEGVRASIYDRHLAFVDFEGVMSVGWGEHEQLSIEFFDWLKASIQYMSTPLNRGEVRHDMPKNTEVVLCTTFNFIGKLKDKVRKKVFENLAEAVPNQKWVFQPTSQGFLEAWDLKDPEYNNQTIELDWNKIKANNKTNFLGKISENLKFMVMGHRTQSIQKSKAIYFIEILELIASFIQKKRKEDGGNDITSEKYKFLQRWQEYEFDLERTLTEFKLEELEDYIAVNLPHAVKSSSFVDNMRKERAGVSNSHFDLQGHPRAFVSSLYMRKNGEFGDNYRERVKADEEQRERRLETLEEYKRDYSSKEYARQAERLESQPKLPVEKCAPFCLEFTPAALSKQEGAFASLKVTPETMDQILGEHQSLNQFDDCEVKTFYTGLYERPGLLRMASLFRRGLESKKNLEEVIREESSSKAEEALVSR